MVKEQTLYLHRYIYTSKHIFKKIFDKKYFSLAFRRVSSFNDLNEGISVLNQRERILFSSEIEISHRALKLHGGFVVTNSEIRKNILKSADSTNLEILKIEKHLECLTNNYASCWFLSDNKFDESRYMWNIYGKTILDRDNECNKNEDCSLNLDKISFKITCALDDFKKALNTKDDSLIFGKVRYSNKYFNSKKPFFIKDESYKHEKEYRIIKEMKDNKDETFIYKLPIEIISSITFADSKNYSLISENKYLSKVFEKSKIKDGVIKKHFNLK